MLTCPVSSLAPTGSQVMFNALPTSTEEVPAGTGESRASVPTEVAQKSGCPELPPLLTTVASPREVSTMYHPELGV